MKFFLNTFITLFCSLSVFGQKNSTVSGILLDKSDNEPVISATVELLNAKDSVFVTGAISTLKGEFTLKNLPPGNYVLKVTYLGYLNMNRPLTLSGQPPSVDLGKLYLQANDILLQETVIEGQRPEVVVRNDTIEYDAASYKTTENAVVEDLLKKLPGVEVDKDGKITVNGKEVKKFMVEGKDFFSDDPQVASKNLPAGMVDKLQVLDRKSDMARMTGFDDGEEETIINLTIRPGMKQGTMGNALAGSGTDLNYDDDWRYQAAAFVNHMQNNDRYTLILGTNNNNNMGAADLGANLFGGMRMRRGNGGVTESTVFMLNMNKELSPSLSLNGDIRYNTSDRFSETAVEQTTLSSVQSQLDKTGTSNRYISDNISGNFTLEWKPDTMNTLILRPNLRYNRSRSNENEHSARFDYNNMDTIFDSYSTAENKGDGYSLGGSLDYSHRFTKPGRVFSINLRASLNDSYSYENSETGYTKKTGFLDDLNQRSENDNNTGSYQGTLSWVEPLGKNNFLQALYRISRQDTKSINSTYDLYNGETWAIRNDSLSRSTVRNSTEQRIGISFKAVRAKYNYTVGFNIDPSNSINETWQPSSANRLELPYNYDSRLANLLGDTLFSSFKQDVVNFSPVVNFNYIFGQRTNLRIDYEGETHQPSASQLRDYTDKSRPTNWEQGNPHLKPGYSNNLRMRFQKYVPETQLTYNMNVNGGFSFNDIVAVTEMQTGGIRLTKYENVNGNWNVQTRGMFNIPLRNKRFSISSFARLAYSSQNSFVDSRKNIQKNFSFGDNSSINYRSDLFDIGVNISLNYSDIAYSIRTDRNQNTLNFGLGGNTTWYLPYNTTLESDINFTQRSGYGEEYNLSETMWNAAVTKQLFDRKFGTGSLKLQVYDILQNRNNISASATTNGFRITESNVIPSFFMCSFIYKFNLFPKSGNNDPETDFRGERPWRGPDGPGPGPGTRRNFGGPGF
ncbi:MAG: outer membrane beta-barrel protein [Candidatus Symbiothrix sp.]|nr:outer membrane beta-barrel protein [Candidatus Symbiothrix sp.]